MTTFLNRRVRQLTGLMDPLFNPDYQHHVEIQVQHFFSKYVKTARSNCFIFFQECFETLVFCKYITVYNYKNDQFI